MRTPLKLLLVEDSAIDAELLCGELKNWGYDVACTRVDTEAAFLDALQQTKWDIILSDYKMPRFAGLRALTLCMEQGVTTPFIFVSGSPSDETRREGKELGAYEYLSKNEIAALEPVLRNALAEAQGKARSAPADS
jgi:CheY-like chemotaxis protein